MIDIPEIQLIAVSAVGFLFGAVFMVYFLSRPILFLLVTGVIFYGVRYIVAENDPRFLPGAVVGNGILSALVLWAVYLSMMLLGRTVTEYHWGKLRG